MGDCDKDEHCEGDSVCHQRESGDLVPGCKAQDSHLAGNADFCIHVDSDPQQDRYDGDDDGQEQL